MNIYKSSEDYLETILILSKDKQYIRAIDIVENMNFSKPSVSIAMKKLRENGYINVNNNGHITLTEEGLKIASNVYERHQILTKALIALGVNEDVAKEDACKLEHDLSEESFQALKRYFNK
ncbi:MAG: metal-dependent transcriptional regulator [Erysipelotrichaceae bacterium]|nr:metal-dependent transcriptional regulator [Erysipelotrichaceae bacterium]